MRAIVQRVSSANVVIDGKEVGACGPGLLLLVGVHRDDTEANAKKLAERLVNLRIFNDDNDKMNLSLLDVGGQVLAISNFTVFGDTTSRRPSFTASAPYERGKELFDHFLGLLRERADHVAAGEFGADMKVSLINDGPVTVVVDG